MNKIIILLLLVIKLEGCVHCTYGGQWSSYYVTGDGRCSYFCADATEKFCASSPAEAEAKMMSDPDIQRQLQEKEKYLLAADRKDCIQLGFKLETDGLANCLLLKKQHRANNTLANFRAENQSAESSNSAFDSAILNSMPKIINCTTIGSQTTCR